MLNEKRNSNNERENNEWEENDKASIIGKITKEFTYIHNCSGQKFYKTVVTVDRRSNIKDNIPVVVSDKLIRENKLVKGKCICVQGEFQSRNRLDQDGVSHLDLFLFAKKIIVSSQIINELFEENSNLIYLDGFICKPPIYRVTPLGREIADLLIAVDKNNKSYYIPCIAWNSNARYVGTLHVGDKISIKGRIQSRKYFKKYSTDSPEGELKEAYEVSVYKLNKMK